MTETKYTLITIQPVIVPAAYGANDQIGAPLVLSGALPQRKAAMLESITIIDTAGQNTGYVVTLFNQLPSVTSSDNQVIEISDANARTQMLGGVLMSATDILNYGTGTTCSTLTLRNIGLVVERASGGELYALLRCTSTPTYGAANDLTVRFGFRLE